MRKPIPCARCPLRESNGWCPHKATTMPPGAPACEYGLRKMNIGRKPRKRKEPVEE